MLGQSWCHRKQSIRAHTGYGRKPSLQNEPLCSSSGPRVSRTAAVPILQIRPLRLSERKEISP